MILERKEQNEHFQLSQFHIWFWPKLHFLYHKQAKKQMTLISRAKVQYTENEVHEMPLLLRLDLRDKKFSRSEYDIK